MIERVTDGERELALIVRRNFRAEGIHFLTPDDYAQQIGYMNRPAGYVIRPHRHHLVSRQVTGTSEVLFVRSGRVRVDFYDESETYLESTVLEPGDVILLIRGGHGFEMLEPSEMIEVKQGPYVGERDKRRFEPVPASAVRMRDAGR